MPEHPRLERLRYGQVFEELLQKLNPEQRRAVQQIEGPVLAIAGPGTGKTHILTARVGEILRQTDAQARNILCLTFTDAGVQAMRQRLLSFIGPEAHRVPIYTFHGFCNRVIQEHTALFGRQDLHSLSDLERMDLVRQILQELEDEHPLRQGVSDIYHYEKQLQDLLRRMKSEAWSMAHVEAAIEAQKKAWLLDPELRYKRNGKDYKVGEYKPKFHQNLKAAEQLHAAALLFNRYQELLLERHAYDYEDMLLWVLQAFDEQDWLLRQYQEEFLYVLVDEFQDTNGAQYHLVERLIEYWGDNPNIFVVGDDDQSIFEFQGARLEHIKSFYERYRANLEVVLLRQNYRSAQHILDASHALIEQNQTRLIRHLAQQGLNLSKKLEAADAEVAGLNPAIRLVNYPNPLQEILGILQAIEGLVAQGVALQDIAILYAKHKQARQLSQILDKKGWKYRSRRQLNLLNQPLVLQLRQLLRYVSEEAILPHSQDALFAELLHLPCFGLEAEDIRQLLLWRLELGLEAKGYPPRWRDLLADKEALAARPWLKPQALASLASFLSEAERSLFAYSLPEFLEYILIRSGLLAQMVHGPESDWAVQVVYGFFQFAQEESYRRPHLSVREFLDTLDRMASGDIPLELYRSTHAEEGLNLLTVHSAKGLEFKHVFILQATESNWESNRGGSTRQRFALPEALTNSAESDGEEADRRLFYVALTRAKASVEVSYALRDEQDKDSSPCRFWTELQSLAGLDAVFRQVSSAEVLRYQMQALQPLDLPPTWRLASESMEGLLQDFKLSASALQAYLDCPLSFYFEYILRLPSSTSLYAAQGTAWHNALRRLSEQAKQNGQYPDEEQGLQALQLEFERQKPFLPRSRYNRLLEQNKQRFARYYGQRRPDWQAELAQTQIFVERPFRQLEIEGVPVVGVLDKIELFQAKGQAPKLRIVDYKTGRIDDKNLRSEQGKYWRQLLFYHLLLDASGLFAGLMAHEACIDYLSEDAEGQFPLKKVHIQDKDRLFMRQLIKETYAKIQAKIFEPGCGKAHCKWCELSRRDQNARFQASYRNENLESLDDRAR